MNYLHFIVHFIVFQIFWADGAMGKEMGTNSCQREFVSDFVY